MANPFANSFMQPVVYFGQYYRVETDNGTSFVPADVSGIVGAYTDLAQYCEGEPSEGDEPAELLSGWLARMSAPGYCDCTEWVAFDTEAKAMQHLIDAYGDEYAE